MKAKLIHKFGGPDVLKLEEVGRPTLKPDEVLIRVRAAGVNPVDWKTREGKFKDKASQLPLILGRDVAGEIDEIGEDVQDFKPGDAVFAMLDQTGAYAEFARASATAVALKPESLDFITSASVPLASLTAYQAIEKMDIQKDQRVLIHGAAGAVGSFAVQFAHLKGAYVIALASMGDGPYLNSIGADEVYTYDSGPFENSIRNLDAVLDVIGGDILTRSWNVLNDGGIIVSTVADPLDHKKRDISARGEFTFTHPDGTMLTEIARLIDAGELKVRVGTVLPLSQAAEAQEIVKGAHHRGKVVLKVA